MPSFSKYDGVYGVTIITGPRSVLLRLELGDERGDEIEVEVEAYPANPPLGYRDPPLAIVRARLFEGINAANRKYGTSFHVRQAKYHVDDCNDEYFMLRWAAFAIIERLATHGSGCYEGVQ